LPDTLLLIAVEDDFCSNWNTTHTKKKKQKKQQVVKERAGYQYLNLFLFWRYA